MQVWRESIFALWLRVKQFCTVSTCAVPQRVSLEFKTIRLLRLKCSQCIFLYPNFMVIGNDNMAASRLRVGTPELCRDNGAISTDKFTATSLIDTVVNTCKRDLCHWCNLRDIDAVAMVKAIQDNMKTHSRRVWMDDEQMQSACFFFVWILKNRNQLGFTKLLFFVV